MNGADEEMDLCIKEGCGGSYGKCMVSPDCHGKPRVSPDSCLAGVPADPCRFACSACGHVLRGKCLAGLTLALELRMEDPELLPTLSKEVLAKWGEVIYKYAWLERKVYKFLPDQGRGKRAELSKDLAYLEKTLAEEHVSNSHAYELLRELCPLLRDISPRRHDLSHGALVMTRVEVFSVGYTETPDAPLHANPMIMRRDSDSETEISDEGLSEILFMLDKAVRLTAAIGEISRTGVSPK